MYRDFIYTVHSKELIEKFDVLTNEKFFYDHHWKQYLKPYEYSSENYICGRCLDKKIITKGSVRYDSLVLCNKHNEEFKPVIKPLYDLFDKLEKEGKCTVYRKLI